MNLSNTYIHESSYVDSDVQIGEGTRVWFFCHIQSGARIGRNCRIGQNVNIGNNVVIGNNVKIQNNVSVYEGVVLEDFVFCGPSMVFTNIMNPRSEYPQRGSEYYTKTLVKRGATLGANSTILCGVTIGRYGFVGAGAVVTKDVPDYALVSGNPATIKGWMCECGVKLDLSSSSVSNEAAQCTKCKKEYSKRKSVVKKIQDTV